MRTQEAIDEKIADRTGVIKGFVGDAAKVEFDDGSFRVLNISHLARMTTI